MKPLTYKELNNSDEKWFFKWVIERYNKRKLTLENGKLKSKIEHLNYLLNEKTTKERQKEIRKFNDKMRVPKRNKSK